VYVDRKALKNTDSQHALSKLSVCLQIRQNWPNAASTEENETQEGIEVEKMRGPHRQIQCQGS